MKSLLNSAGYIVKICFCFLLFYSCASHSPQNKKERVGDKVERCGIFSKTFTGDTSRGMQNISSETQSPDGLLVVNGQKYYLDYSSKVSSIDRMKISSWVDEGADTNAHLCVSGKIARSNFTYNKILIEEAW